MNDRRGVNVSLGSEVQNYKIRILNSGVCGNMLPVSIIKSGDATLAIYNIDGYRKLESLKSLSASSVLSIISLIIQMVEGCKDYLIYPDEYDLDVSTVYIDANMKRVKLLYIPSRLERYGDEMGNYNSNTLEEIFMQSCMCEIKQIEKIIQQLKNHSSPSGEEYLETLEEMICREGMKSGAVLGLIENLIEEAKLCQA